MQVAILAGGLGTRLGLLTKNQPKSMVRVLGKPFLEYQLEFLRNAGFTEIVLCLGYLAQPIKDYFGDGTRFGTNIKYSLEERPLDTAGALKNAEALLVDTFFTLYGDSYLSLNFAKIQSLFNTQNILGLMTVYRNNDEFDRSNTAVGAGLVKQYSKTTKSADMVYIDYGANLFRKEVFKLVPDGSPYPMEMLFQQLIARKELLAYEVTDRFYEVGSLRGLAEFETHIKNKQTLVRSRK